MILLAAACVPDPPSPPAPVPVPIAPSPTLPDTTFTPIDTGHPDAAVVIAAVGDYGTGSTDAGDVGALVAEWSPDAVVTLGDNNYPSGAADTIDTVIGAVWAPWIAPYVGKHGPGATENRFFPSLGNHDWYTDDAAAYLDYFELPGNERYYVLERGPIDLFCLDSDTHEPDGVLPGSVQAAWLRQAVAASDATYQVVYFHHPPVSSGSHGDTPWMQWPWAAWGVDLVLAGHDHDFERLTFDGVDVIVNGLGGTSLRDLRSPRAGAQIGSDHEHGATFLLLEEDGLVRVHTVATDGTVIDRASLHRDRPASPEWAVLPFGADWVRWDEASPPAATWFEPGFDDTFWPVGIAPLGYGHARVTTAIDYGGDPANRRPSAWFRTTFTVADPSALDAARLEVRAEDGFLAFLNGQQLARAGLPAGAVTPDTLAVAEGDASVVTSFALDPAMLVPGVNVVAVEVHHSAPADPELVWDASIVGIRSARLVAADAAWRFLDDGAGPADETWREPGFDDRDWRSGAAPLGFGAEVSTEIAGPHLATWYRTTFEAPADVGSALLRLTVDDGVVAWLNGVEVYRARMPGGRITATTPAAPAPTAASWDVALAATWVDPALLRAGENVLAVEVHLDTAEATSSRFGAELVPFAD